MRKLLFLLLLTVSFSSCQMHLSQASDKVSKEDLPASAQFIIKNHFEGNEIKSVTRERKDENYAVDFTNNQRLVFDSEGDWIEIDCKNHNIPLLLIPSKIRNYIAKKYGTNAQAVCMRKTKEKIEIKLSNQITFTI